jgi:hypothetical protein
MKMVLGLVRLDSKIEDGIQYYVWFLKNKASQTLWPCQ